MSSVVGGSAAAHGQVHTWALVELTRLRSKNGLRAAYAVAYLDQSWLALTSAQRFYQPLRCVATEVQEGRIYSLRQGCQRKAYLFSCRRGAIPAKRVTSSRVSLPTPAPHAVCEADYPW